MSEPIVDEDSVFKALAAPTRRRVLDLLKDHPRTTSQLCEEFPGLDRCTVMQHLRVLESAGLVIVQRKGRQRWNHLDPLPIKHVHDRWIGDYAATAIKLVASMKAELETKRPRQTQPNRRRDSTDRGAGRESGAASGSPWRPTRQAPAATDAEAARETTQEESLGRATRGAKPLSIGRADPTCSVGPDKPAAPTGDA